MQYKKPSQCHFAMFCGVATIMLLASPVLAADVSTTGSDGFGTTSFTTAGVWSDGLAPSAGNDYFIETGHRVRTPPDGVSYTFAGDSLTVRDGGTNEASGLSFKGTGDTGTITINNLILDGGDINHINGTGDVFNLDGAINVVSASTIYAKQGAIHIMAAISGSGSITNPGSDGDGRTLFIESAANTFNGDIINNGRLDLIDGAVMNFAIGANGVNNSISGTGAATTLSGTFNIDTSGASSNTDDAWTLVSASNVTYGTTFNVAGYTEVIPGVWDGTDYWFEAATGVLHYGEPPISTGIFLNTGGDAIGDSSFDNDGANNWDDGQDPSSGKDYVVTVQFLRSPLDSANYTFQGDTLTFRTGGGLISKHTGTRTLTANWVMDGGLIRSGSGDEALEILAGTMAVTENGGEIRADQTPYEISAPISGSAGTLTLSSGFTLTVSGAGTFTGDVNASGTDLLWSDTSSWSFVIGASGVNNTIAGTGSAEFNGTFDFDLTNAGSMLGDTWQIVDVATQTFGTSFNISGFTEASTSVWTSGMYRFDESTGVLSYGAPPGFWDGDSSNAWNLAANWSADLLPTFTGFTSTLNFADAGASGGTLNNDVVGAELAGIDYTTDAPAFVLSGNAVSISTAITNNSANTQTLSLPIEASENLSVNAAGAPIVLSGVLSGTAGLVKNGAETLTLSNAGNTIAGDITFNGEGSIVVATSGALGDPNSRVLLNANFQGPLAALEFTGGVTQTKHYDIYTRTDAEPMHVISSAGVNTLDGLITNVSGGTYIHMQVDSGSTLNLDADWDASNGLGADILSVVGPGTLNFNCAVTDLVGQEIGIDAINGAMVNVNGANDMSGNLVAINGTIALVDAASSNNVPNVAMLQAQSSGTLDFSGLLSGGIALSDGQTLSGEGNFVGSVDAGLGSILDPGIDGVGTMDLASLTLEDGAQINIDIADGDSDLININGLLTGPSSGAVHVAATFSGGIMAGSYVIADWTSGGASGVSLSDFTSNIGTLSVVSSQLILTITFDELAEVLVSDTGNSRVLKYIVTQYGAWAVDTVQPVFAEGTVGDYALESPVGLAKDSANNVYIAEGLTDLQDRVLKLDADGNYLATVAEIDSFDANLVYSGTPSHIVIDPTDSYLFIAVDQPNTTATDPNLEDVIWRVDLSGATAPVIYIDTTDLANSYELQDPQGLEFGPDGYLYVSNNLDPASTSPDPGSRILRFDVSGSTGVYAGTLTTEHRDTKGLFYDNVLNRLMVSLNALNDIWAYTDLTQDLVANDPANGAFEFVYEQDADVNYPDIVTAVGMVFFTNSTDNSIGMVTGVNSATEALGASAGLLSPHSLLVLSEFNAFDFNNDGQVNGADLGVMAFAINGPDVTTPPVTVTQDVFNRADIDKDGDVDMVDYAVMQQQAN